MLHVVLKPLPGPEGTIPSGTVVDPDNWKNVGSLVNLRYLRPITPQDVAGRDEIEVDEYGVSTINVFVEEKPKAKKATIRKAKH